MNGQTKLEDDMTKTALVLLFSGTVFAQQAVVDHCKNTSSDADRIACLEAALLGKEITAEPVAEIAAEPVAEIVAVPVAEIAAEAAVEPEGIGASQVIARTQTQEEKLEQLEKAEGLVVASYDKVPYEKLMVTLENGQIWRQITGDTQIIRVDLKRNQTVNIEESSLSGYKLRLNEMRRTIRVQRVQ
jgi:hypothetical protein